MIAIAQSLFKGKFMTTPSNCNKLRTFCDELDRGELLKIQSNQYWYKIVEFLQTNWALIDEQANGTARVWFINDNSGVFDSMFFETLEAAVDGLMNNGFDLFSENPDAAKFLTPPEGPYKREPHPNGHIYSEGKFWNAGKSRL